jgi:hypothetical protein
VTRTVREVGPLAVVVGVACAVTLYLLGANPTLGRWILAALLFAHGWVHLMFVFPKPPPPKNAAPASATAWPFDLGSSWLIGRAGLPPATVRAIGKVLVVIAFAGFLLAALATAGVLVPAAWWAGLGLVGAAASAVLLAIAFSPTLLLGFAIDIAVAWLVLAGPWTPVGA